MQLCCSVPGFLTSGVQVVPEDGSLGSELSWTNLALFRGTFTHKVWCLVDVSMFML